MASHMSNRVRERILRRCANNETVVVVARDGKPARVFSLERFLKMKEQPRKHKPWTFRKSNKEVPDPLGVRALNINGRILGPLTRRHMYEELD